MSPNKKTRQGGLVCWRQPSPVAIPPCCQPCRRVLGGALNPVQFPTNELRQLFVSSQHVLKAIPIKTVGTVKILGSHESAPRVAVWWSGSSERVNAHSGPRCCVVTSTEQLLDPREAFAILQRFADAGFIAQSAMISRACSVVGDPSDSAATMP